jgi:hypothetical protein
VASAFAAGAVIAIFGAAGAASASKVNCAGSLGPSAKDPESTVTAEWSFYCDQDVYAFSIGFNKQITLFDPEVIATNVATGEGTGELASCEGPFPGAGIGCTFQSSSCPSSGTACAGKMAVGAMAKAEVEAAKPYCAATRKQKTLDAWLTVTTQETTAAGKTFFIASPPFHLDNELGCAKPPKSKPRH